MHLYKILDYLELLYNSEFSSKKHVDIESINLDFKKEVIYFHVITEEKEGTIVDNEEVSFYDFEVWADRKVWDK